MKHMKPTVIEIIIVIVIIGLLASLAIPCFVERKRELEMLNILSVVELNDYKINSARLVKAFEFRDHDIYTFTKDGYMYSVAIPITNSVYNIERK